MKEEKKRKLIDYLFIVNPSSGAGESPDIKKVIKDHRESDDISWEIFMLDNEIDPDSILQKLEESRPAIAVACGGDGTVNLVSRLIMDSNIKLGIIPLGSANGMAFQLGIPADPEEALDILFRDKSRNIDLIRVNKSRVFMHMGDIGMNARVVKRYENEGIRGFYGYARQYFKELGSTRKFRCTVKTDDRKYKSGVVMVIIANATHYGTGAIVNPDGDIGDGKFEVILIRTFPFYFIFYLLRNFFLRKKGDKKFIRTISCTHAEISVSPPQEVQVDGEHIGTESLVHAEVLPGKIRVISG